MNCQCSPSARGCISAAAVAKLAQRSSWSRPEWRAGSPARVSWTGLRSPATNRAESASRVSFWRVARTQLCAYERIRRETWSLSLAAQRNGNFNTQLEPFAWRSRGLAAELLLATRTADRPGAFAHKFTVAKLCQLHKKALLLLLLIASVHSHGLGRCPE